MTVDQPENSIEMGQSDQVIWMNSIQSTIPDINWTGKKVEI